MTTNKPMVSVCVQTYNHEKYIMECLNGILEQEVNFNYEVIIGEDESSDATREICKAYALKYPEKIKLFLRQRKNNIYIDGKPSGRFNFIENLKACSGKYIALCEGDDYWTDQHKLQEQVNFLEQNPEYSGSFHNTEFIDENLNSKPRPWRSYNKTHYELQDLIDTKALFHTSSFVFRKQWLKFPNWFTKVQSGDMALFMLIANNGPLHRIDKSMSVYRKNQGGVTNSISFRNYHNSRILLFNCIEKELDLSKSDKLRAVKNFHKAELKKLFWQSVRYRLKTLIKKK